MPDAHRYRADEIANIYVSIASVDNNHDGQTR